MIALRSSYMELLNKLDKDEKIECITKTMKDVRKESAVYEEKYADTIIAFKKLREIKSEILENSIEEEISCSHLYSIPEIDNEDIMDHVLYNPMLDDGDDAIKELKSLKKNVATANNEDIKL